MSITDNFENASFVQYDHVCTEDCEPDCNKHWKKTYATDSSDKKPITIDGKFDIVSSTFAPTISNINLDVKNTKTEYKYLDSNNKVWFSAQPELTFTVTDKVSKIHSLQVFVNGDNKTNYATKCTYNNGQPYNGPFTDFDTGKGDPVESINVTLNTALISEIHEGENKIKISATGNNNVTSEGIEIPFYLDYTSPEIQKFDFTDNSSRTAPREGHNNKAFENGSVTKTEYGYFIREKTTVIVSATDNIKLDGSGVADIKLYIKSIYSQSVDEIKGTFDKSNQQATFNINPGQNGFKGQIYAFAIDNVNNNQYATNFTPGVADSKYRVFTPDSVVVETEKQHKDNSMVKITPVTKPVSKDHKGNDLFNGNVEVMLEAKSTFAGIKSIKYEVTADYDKGRNQGDTGDVDAEGNITNGWIKLSSDANLLTSARKLITVSNNSNDIKIKLIVTDRCDYSSETDLTISIDKEVPEIHVSFSPDKGNPVDNGHYFKTDRTATITVYERNFNPADFKLTINNATYSVTPGQNWNTSYSFAGDPDKTPHVATYTFHDDNDYKMVSSFVDMAKNAAKDDIQDEFTVDQTAPKISVTFDVNNSSTYYNVTRTATITIEEHNFYAGADYLKIVQDARGADNSTSVTPPAVSGWTTSGDTSRATITFADDGMYSFTVDFKDKALNDAVQYKENTFYIDKKIDTLEITNVEDLKAYDGEVAPVINYFDQNFAEGTYNLKKVDFGSDPETVKDIIPNESSGGGFSKIVSYSNFKKTVENDGIYMLNAHIKDKAGNEKDENKLFSVNRFGSNFMITDATTKDLVENKIYTNDAPDIQITEINVNPVTNTKIQVKRDDSNNELAKGSDFEVSQKSGNSRSWYAYDYKIFKKNFDNEGGYSLTVSSTDTFKKVISNRTAYTDKTNPELNHSKPVEFVVDKTAPIVTISGLESEYYEESSRDVTVICDDANITSDNLTVQFDNEDFKDYTISETSANIELNLKLESANGNIDREFNVVVYDKAGNRNDLEECGQVKGFRLSTSWIARVLHYNLPIVIAVGGVLVAGIALAIFLAIRKRKKNNQ